MLLNLTQTAICTGISKNKCLLYDIFYPQIKAAHYSVLAIVCEVQPELANEFADKLCPLVLHNLDESDPIICRALWEAVLHTLATVEVSAFSS